MFLSINASALTQEEAKKKYLNKKLELVEGISIIEINFSYIL